MILDKLNINKDKPEEDVLIQKGKDGKIKRIVMPSSKPIKIKITKLLSSRLDIDQKYNEFYKIVKYAFSIFLKIKNPKYSEKELSYEEIKQAIITLEKEDKEDIHIENAISFLDKLTELSYAPYKYSTDEKEMLKEKKEQLQYIAEEFKSLLW